MRRQRSGLRTACFLFAVGRRRAASASPQTTPAAPPPVVVFETVKGTFEIQLFAADAPKSVEHIVGLVKRGFYRGQRIHRVTPTLVQWGDPKSKDMTYRELLGHAAAAAVRSTRSSSRKSIARSRRGRPGAFRQSAWPPTASCT